MAKAKKKSGKQAPTVTPTPWDHGAAGPANRLGLVVEERGTVSPITGKLENPNRVTGARRVDMLEVWHRKGDIGTAGYNAAVKLRDAFEATMRSPSIALEQDRVDSSPKPDHAVTIQIDRIGAFHRINRLVAFQDRALIDHCVLHSGTPATLRIKGARPYHGRNYTAGLEALAEGLDRLAKAMGG